MGLITKLIGAAITIAGASTAIEKISEKIDEKRANKKAEKMAAESKDAKLIKIGGFIDELYNENYIEVQKTLIAYGFKDIHLVAKKDLKRKKSLMQQALVASGINNIEFKEKKNPKDGRVETIAFNGETDFDEHSTFPTNAVVVISYHTYTDAKDEDEVRCIESIVEKAFSKCQCCGSNFEYDIKKPKCPYCGAAVDERK